MTITPPTKIIITIMGIFLIIIGWAPWLTTAKVRSIVQTYPNFQEQHDQAPIDPEEIYVAPTPFCRAVTTYEGMWWVCFWEKPPTNTVLPPSEQPNLPIGYTPDNYTVEKITTTSCTRTTECVTPIEYQIRSSCPFTSLCLNNTCTVVCPEFSGR